jgi:hypothetical protein
MESNLFYTDQSLRDLKFADKWPLLFNSLAFMVAGMLIILLSIRNKRSSATFEKNYYMYMNNGRGTKIVNQRQVTRFG